jgi:hypothetical protein
MKLSVIHTCAEDFENYESKYNQFLKQIADSDSPALPNMGNDAPAGLVYLTKKQARWTKKTGEIALLYDDDIGSIVGVSAVEHSTLSDKLGSGGNRCWVLPQYRKNNEVTRFLLTGNLQWCTQQHKVGMLLTFNEYNKWIYDTIAKLSAGKGAAFGTVWSDWWDDCVVLPRKINLFDTPQWAVVKPLANKPDVLKVIEEVDREFGLE